MHPLLKRQITKQFGQDDYPPEFEDFIQTIDKAYHKADTDFELLSHSLDEMSRELNERNDTLRRERDEQKALAKRLEETTNQLLQSEKMASIGQLAAGVAHEINNPVGYINSNINALGDYVGDLLRLLNRYEETHAEILPATLRDIQDLRASADIDYIKTELPSMIAESREGITRVKRIVQDLKSFSHADTGVFVWADLHNGLDSTLNVATNEIKYKADVVREYGAIPLVECLPSQLNQVFMNLLVNAAQAMPEGRRGTITVRTSAIDEQSVAIEIADNGSGIQPENLTRIFDPFFTTKPVGKGTGLGLSLSYGIIQKHQGSIEVHSQPDQGTSFRIVLPVRQT